MTTSDIQLLKRTTCPHCWHGFPPEDVLWVSAHSDLMGDPPLGPEHQQCFRPTRFGLEGNARDSHGVPCTALACPNCHLPIPRGLVGDGALLPRLDPRRAGAAASRTCWPR